MQHFTFLIKHFDIYTRTAHLTYINAKTVLKPW